MVFVEFYVGRKVMFHFVGLNLPEVLADTNGGTQFGFQKLDRYRVVSREHVETLNLQYFEDGVASVQNGVSKSYLLGNPMKT